MRSHTGEIIIGNFKETFTMPLNSWTVAQYQKQWNAGLARITTDNYSCLVATVQNLNTNPLIFIWTLYKEKGKIFIQNNILNNEIIAETNPGLNLNDFNSETCYEFIDYPRKTTTEDGSSISEWSIDIKSIKYNFE